MSTSVTPFAAEFPFFHPTQTRAKFIWFANARFEPGFDAEGFSPPRNQPPAAPQPI
jgi:hypothetical protein